MAVYWRPSSWQDWAVPAVLLIGAEFETWVPGVAKVSGPRLIFGVIALVCAALLLVRRRYPIVASLILCGLFMIPTMLGWFIQSTSMVLMLVVAIFAAGRYGARPAAYLAVPASALVVLGSSAVDPDQGGLESWPWSLNTVWIFVLGAAFRHERTLREQVAAAAESDSRAAAAEARVQVARDLHDVLSHSLSVVAVQAEVADTFLESDQDKARQAIRRVATTARAALADTRRMVGLLRDPDTDEPTVAQPGVADVPALVERIRESGVLVTLELSPDLPALTAQATMTAYRVVQESLTNVLRHAGKVPTRVQLAPLNGSLLIEVWDAGGEEILESPPGGAGLVGMRERVLSCGGDVTSGPDPEGGFRVRVVLPAEGTP